MKKKHLKNFIKQKSEQERGERNIICKTFQASFYTCNYKCKPKPIRKQQMQAINDLFMGLQYIPRTIIIFQLSFVKFYISQTYKTFLQAFRPLSLYFFIDISLIFLIFSYLFFSFFFNPILDLEGLFIEFYQDFGMF